MKVTKRDGTKENYSIQTVKRAIREAFKSSKQKYSKDIINEITSTIDPYDGIPVEDIQDQIETSLYSHNYPMVAKEFILYRNKKRQIRDWVKNKEEFIEKYKRSTNTANSTVDDNSNVASKNIGVLNAEIHKGDNINVSRGMVTHKLKELFPDFNAKQYVKDKMRLNSIKSKQSKNIQINNNRLTANQHQNAGNVKEIKLTEPNKGNKDISKNRNIDKKTINKKDLDIILKVVNDDYLNSIEMLKTQEEQIKTMLQFIDLNEK